MAAVATFALLGDESKAVAQVEAGQVMLVERSLSESTLAVAVSDITESGVELRFHTRSGWGEWMPVEPPVDEAPDHDAPGEPDGSPSFGPVWLGGTADRLEIRRRGATLDPTPTFEAPTVHSISAEDIAGPADDRSGSLSSGFPGAGPSGGFSASAATAVRFLPVRQLLQAPAIRPRSSWTTRTWASDTEGCESGPRSASSLRAAVVHHTVTSNNYAADQVDDILRAIHFTHTVINGWCDIGYNFVVDRFGTIWEGRSGSLGGQIIGGHTRGFNTTTVGVALLGQHQSGSTSAGSGVEPASAARSAVQRVAAWKLASHGVDPTGRTWLRNRSDSEPLRLAGTDWHYVPTILGHRDLGVTSCPGDLSYTHVHVMGVGIQRAQGSHAIFNRPQWIHATHGPAVVTSTSDGGLMTAGAATNDLTGSGPGTEITGEVIAVAGGASGGYRLYDNGSLAPFGTAVDLAVGSAWLPPGVNPVDLAVAEAGGVWVLTSDGVIHHLGGAPPVLGPVGVRAGGPVALSLNSSGSGYVATASGRLLSVGEAATIEATFEQGARLVDVAVNERAYPAPEDDSPTGPTLTETVWVLDDSGRVHVVSPSGHRSSHHFLDVLAGPRRQGLELGSVDLSSLKAQALVASTDEGGAWVLDQFGQLWPVGDARLLTPVSTRSAFGDVVDVALLGLVADENFLSSEDARYISALYQLFEGRQAPPGEISEAVRELEIGTTRLEVISPLVAGPGWAGTRVDDVYQRVLRRAPAGTGRQYWLSRLAGGMSFEQLGTMFYGSPEYYRSAGSNDEFVRRLFRALLDREPAEGGLAYWTGLLGSGQLQPAGVAGQFYRSLESRRDRTVRLYGEILSRTPNSSELTDGARLLTTADDGDLAAELASSTEFYRIVAEG